MKKLLSIIVLLFLTTVSFSQEPEEKKEKLSMTEKMFMKMMFKKVEQPELTKIFDRYENEMGIVSLTSSQYEDLAIVIFATIELEDYEFTLKSNEEMDPSSFDYGTLTHFSGIEIRYMDAVSKDKEKKLREYILTYDSATFVLIYSAPPQFFAKGISDADNVAIKVKKK